VLGKLRREEVLAIGRRSGIRHGMG
jgi:hypothetical protein